MPDLTIEIMQQCASLNQGGSVHGYHQEYIGGEPHCTCPAFKFAKRDAKYCKHLSEWEAESCTYHQQLDGPPKVDGVCPKCGGATEYVRVGV